MPVCVCPSPSPALPCCAACMRCACACRTACAQQCRTTVPSRCHSSSASAGTNVQHVSFLLCVCVFGGGIRLIHAFTRTCRKKHLHRRWLIVIPSLTLWFLVRLCRQRDRTLTKLCKRCCTSATSQQSSRACTVSRSQWHRERRRKGVCVTWRVCELTSRHTAPSVVAVDCC